MHHRSCDIKSILCPPAVKTGSRLDLGHGWSFAKLLYNTVSHTQLNKMLKTSWYTGWARVMLLIFMCSWIYLFRYQVLNLGPCACQVGIVPLSYIPGPLLIFSCEMKRQRRWNDLPKATESTKKLGLASDLPGCKPQAPSCCNQRLPSPWVRPWANSFRWECVLRPPRSYPREQDSSISLLPTDPTKGQELI